MFKMIQKMHNFDRKPFTTLVTIAKICSVEFECFSTVRPIFLVRPFVLFTAGHFMTLFPFVFLLKCFREVDQRDIQ